MAYKIYNKQLDIKGEQIENIGNVTQNDVNANVFSFTLMDGFTPIEILPTNTATFTVVKPNDNKVVMNADITVDKEIVVTLPKGAIDLPGKYRGTIELYDENIRVTSARFTYTVTAELNPDADEVILQTDEYPVLTSLISQVQEINNVAVNAKNEAVSAKEISVTASSEAVSAKNETVLAKNEVMSAKEETISAKDLAEASKIATESAKQEAIDAKNDTVLAKNIAESAKETALQSSQTATEKATLAESWAIGGTGTRSGEDVDNAKYYAMLAQAGFGGGDMLKSVYDTNNSGVVDNAERLGGKLPSEYVAAEQGKGLSTNDFTDADKQRLDNVPSSTLTFTNVSVPTTLWSADTTFSDYPYKADISLVGVTANHVPDVVFSSEYVENSIFHYLAETLEGKVRIWAKSIPSGSITISTITCVKGVS